MNKKRVTVEMPNELFEKLSNNAWRARLSVSEYVRRLIEKDDVPKKGQKK
jgi:predicted DNA-binding protein